MSESNTRLLLCRQSYVPLYEHCVVTSIGVEPIFTGSEPVVLPLNDKAKHSARVCLSASFPLPCYGDAPDIHATSSIGSPSSVTQISPEPYVTRLKDLFTCVLSLGDHTT